MVLRGVVLQRGELGLELGLAHLLLVERRLRGIRGLLRRDHLLLGLLLQPVALGAGDDGLVAEALGGVARGDRLGVHVVVALDELVHRAEARQQVVGRRGRAREEELERGVVSAVAVELRGDAAGLVRGIQRRRGLLVGLLLQLLGAVGGVEVGLLGDVELVGGLLRERALRRDVVGEGLDEALDLGDLGLLGRLVGLRPHDVVPRRIVRGERGRDEGGAQRTERREPEDAEAERAAAAHRRPQQAALTRTGCAVALVFDAPVRTPLDPPPASIHRFTLATSVTRATESDPLYLHPAPCSARIAPGQSASASAGGLRATRPRLAHPTWIAYA